MKKHIGVIISLICVINFTTFAQTHINVLPDTTVEVGEEVYFDAMYYETSISDTLQFEWDFGDGYSLYAHTSGNPFETGLCAVHYFMTPGVYNVKLTGSSFNMYTSPPSRISTLVTDSITITVTGEAPLSGFELWHAPFHARTAQYLYAIVTNEYTPSQVTARIEKVGGGYSQELTGITVNNKQKFLLNNASLPAGDYVVTAELRNGETVVSRIREKFSKPYDGAPKVGINENNAFIIDGSTLFFPIGPFLLDKGGIPLWAKVSNTLHTEGYYDTHIPATWVDYITTGNAQNLMSVGPLRWEGFKGAPYTRNSNLNNLLLYVQQGKNTAGLLGWCWDDEPNMGGRYNKVPAHVLAGWDYRTRIEDPQHPTSQQYYGFDWQPHYNPLTGVHPYSYMRSASAFGGKKTFLADFFTHDAYLIEYKEHLSFDYSNRGVVDIWLNNLDNFTWNMADLVPLGTFIEPQNVTSFQRMSGTSYLTQWDAGPTPGDIRTQAWGAVIHGMKYVGYFQFFAPTPADNFSVLGEFKEAVTALTPIILSPPSSRTVTHNCNTRGNRVDLTVRENGTDIFIFAIRVTEPESEWNEVYEPETINLELNTGINSSLAYDEFPQYRWSYLKLDATEGQTTFNCTVPEGSIMPNSIIVSAVKSAPSGTMPDSLYDRWTGKGYPTALDIGGNLKYGYDDGNGNILSASSLTLDKISGTVNYSTGQIQLNSVQGIPQGRGFVQIAYAPANRQVREVSISGGVISDVLERNAVRIYRIPLVSGIDNQGSIPNKFELYQNYPNPFNPSTKIQFSIGTGSYVSLKIYDVLGREVVTLVNGMQSPGEHTIEWNGTNSSGQHVASGVYFYQLQTSSGYSATKKMMLLK